MGNAIYVVDADTGGLIFWISSDDTADINPVDMKYAIPSTVAVFDSDGNGLDDRLYVGDVAGQIWRVDLAGNITLGASSDPQGNTMVGRFANLSTQNTVAEERRFFYPPAIIQTKDEIYSDAVKGLYDYILISTGNRSHPLDLNVENRFYALRDSTIDPMTYNSSNIAVNYPSAININDGPISAISNVDLTDITDLVLSAGLDSNDTAHTNAVGWYYDFTKGGTTGEKGLSTPTVIDGNVLFTTFVPAAPIPCQAVEGSSFIYGFDLLSAKAAIDWDGNVGNDIKKEIKGWDTLGGVVSISTADGIYIIVDIGDAIKVTDSESFQHTYWYQELQ